LITYHSNTSVYIFLLVGIGYAYISLGLVHITKDNDAIQRFQPGMDPGYRFLFSTGHGGWGGKRKGKKKMVTRRAEFIHSLLHTFISYRCMSSIIIHVSRRVPPRGFSARGALALDQHCRRLAIARRLAVESIATDLMRSGPEVAAMTPQGGTGGSPLPLHITNPAQQAYISELLAFNLERLHKVFNSPPLPWTSPLL
jgi:hypothetical protein